MVSQGRSGPWYRACRYCRWSGRFTEYRAQGPYIAFRVKVDQDTLKLNERKSVQPSRAKP